MVSKKKIKKPKVRSIKRLRLTPKTGLILLGCLIVILYGVVSFTANTTSLGLHKDTNKSLEELSSVGNPSVTPVQTVTPKTTTARYVPPPTATPTMTPAATPTPGHNTVYGRYMAGNGQDFIFNGARAVLTKVDGGQTFTTTDNPKWTIANIPPGKYKITIEKYEDYENSILFCYEGLMCFAKDKFSGREGEIDVQVDRAITLDLIYYRSQ